MPYVIAYNTPRVLLKRRWQTMFKEFLDYLDITRQVIFSILYITIDLIGLLYEKNDLFSEYVLHESDRKTLEELNLNGKLDYHFTVHYYSEIIINCIVRLIQFMFLLSCYFQFKKYYRTSEYLKNTKSYKASKKFAQLKRLEFKDLKEGQGCPTCCICLGNFEQNSNIVALGCHKTHIFHRKCMNLHIQNCLQEAKSQMDVWNQINLQGHE